MAEFGLRIDGVTELLKVMDAIEKDIEAANGAAVVAGARVIQREARRLCPEGTKPVKTYLGTYRQPGNLKKSIKIKLLKAKEEGQRVAIVGPATGKRERNDGFYGRFVEEGHRTQRRRVSYSKNWKYKGEKIYQKWEYGDSKTAPRPFLRPAFDSKIGDAKQKMSEVYRQALDGKLQKGKLVEAIGDIIEG
jgi:HK97 gp10 family phage protein